MLEILLRDKISTRQKKVVHKDRNMETKERSEDLRNDGSILSGECQVDIGYKLHKTECPGVDE